MKIFGILCLVLLFNYITPKLNKDRVVIAINCGGQGFKDSDGVYYQKDNYFDAGVTSDYGLNYDITNTRDMELYQTERWHSDSFSYNIPLKEPGKYVLILKFSEVYFTAPNEKVFDVAIGKKIVVKDLDVFERAGNKAVAHDEFVEFELKDDRIYFNKQEVPNGYDPVNKTIKVRFVKGLKDNPKINSIIIYKGDVMDTDYADKRKQQEEINKKKILEAKKEKLVELKHHPDEIYDEEAALSMDLEDLISRDERSLLQIFNTTQGMFILISFAIFLGMNFMLDALENHGSKNKKAKKD